MSKLLCVRVLMASSAIVLAGLIGCGDTTGPLRRAELTLRLTTDSAYVPTSPCAAIYCIKAVPSSGTMTARLVYGSETTSDTDPTCCSGIIGVFNEVTFADSITGNAVLDLDSVMTVRVGLVPFKGYYDYFSLVGRMRDGQYSGRWRQENSPHGFGNVGSFVTVP